ncbi:MAG TPA: FkbM family methyltransferase [Pyrinomonadaceae bacterium]|jgi:FkbM family methyltransferase
MFDDILHRNERLRQRLASLTVEQDSVVPPSPTLIITAAEVNQRHGTGVLVSRIFGATPDVVAIRTHSHYDSEQDFGAASFCLPQKELSRAEIFFIVYRWLTGATARRIVCVPYYSEDLLVAIAARELFNAPLCIYIMDDHNIHSRAIPDDLMEEALRKSDLRLAISTEMQHAYQDKYRLKFWVLPPVVSDELVLREAAALPVDERADASTGVLVGNIWGQRWLNLLRETIRGSGTKLHWYPNSGRRVPAWLKVNMEELAQDGILLHEALPEAELAEVLRKCSFAVLPSGTLDDTDDNVGIARLSLPTRIPFILASSHTPIIVIGNHRTASSRFVKRFQIGTVCDYEPGSYRSAVDYVTAPETQRLMRRNASRLAGAFAARGTAEWVWKSLEQGEPCEMKYEKLLGLPGDEFAFYVEPPVPKSVPVDFAPTYRALRRLKSKGFEPDFVIDIGASTGVWSQVVSLLFTEARFILVDAVASKYDEASRVYEAPGHDRFEMVEAAVSDKPGRASFQVSSDLYNSSLVKVNEIVQLDEVVEVEVLTLDQLARSKTITGRGLLKMDVQYAEHRIIEGGPRFICEQVDAIIMELTLLRPVEEAKTFLEMVWMMDRMGFRYYDDTGEWRRPTDGSLEQKDVLFVRHALFLEA